ncbi:methyltransferase domain-containing protein [Sinimarinibacterium sp. CAU 1509]|uniref:methyltransferase domain-containing protein n=1 Tax=Sinimarinibacterium sp. CAU 1509 TaxID=2562283 RepID=UPI0010AC68A6|nr:methyltransferase domain-containing protein [Sinimarinibacterium sp. CAU 1509]TJY59847.1 methyltransferase domain-containing protein [Sinimarinibacterium sp. CAU 1509]
MTQPVAPAPLDADFWEQRYQSQQTGWDRGDASPALQQWLAADALPPGRVLVPGCGRGHEVVALAQAGYVVTAVDLAPSAIEAVAEKLRQAGTQAQLIHADLLQWTPEQAFDAVYEQTCLCALTPSLWPAYAARLALWVRPGGTLAILFMQTGRDGGPPFHCALPRMHELFDPELWEWPEKDDRLTIKHPNGGTELGYRLTRRS